MNSDGCDTTVLDNPEGRAARRALARRRACVVPALALLALCGCHAGDSAGAGRRPAVTQPAGRDLDREGIDASRRLTSLGGSTVRVYDASDGWFVVDEKQTFDGPGLMDYLNRQGRGRLRDGIVYFVSQGDIQDRAAFARIKDFCIRRNVNLYLGEGGWARRRPAWTLDPAVHEDVTWIVQARP